MVLETIPIGQRSKLGQRQNVLGSRPDRSWRDRTRQCFSLSRETKSRECSVPNIAYIKPPTHRHRRLVSAAHHSAATFSREGPARGHGIPGNSSSLHCKRASRIQRACRSRAPARSSCRLALPSSASSWLMQTMASVLLETTFASSCNGGACRHGRMVKKRTDLVIGVKTEAAANSWFNFSKMQRKLLRPVTSCCHAVSKATSNVPAASAAADLRSSHDPTSTKQILRSGCSKDTDL